MRYFLTNLIRFTLIGSIPLIILFIGYVRHDPFKVLYAYSDYSNSNVILNRDYISTEMFLKNKGKYNYNSFILGSSRTVAFSPTSWKKHLVKKDNPFMFDASKENIYGIYSKIKYLDSIDNKINNIIILICRDATFNIQTIDNGHLFKKHYALSSESKIAFQYSFFKAYLSPKFLFNFYLYQYSKSYQKCMIGYLESRKITYDTITNQDKIIDQELEIKTNSVEYYHKKRFVFYDRTKEKNDSLQKIMPEHIAILKEIKRILIKNKTNYKIIISPLYEQVKMNNKDLATLNSIFGNHIYNFSGKNYFTENKINYYEASHYRPIVGDSILSIIYKN